MKFVLHLVQESRLEWKPVYRDPAGNVLDTSKENWHEGLDFKVSVDWEQTDNRIIASYVDRVMVQDDDRCKQAKPIVMYATLDGPILGIELDRDAEGVTLLDPCMVQFDPDKGFVHYVPIFNVARTLRLLRPALRTRQAPAELIIANYPGFIIQNRMYKYQIKPVVPLASTQAEDNDAEELVAPVVT